MSPLNDIFGQIEAAGAGMMMTWEEECARRITEFARVVQPSSPFKDLPKYNKRPSLSKFWARKNTKKREINIFGIAPNISRIKGFNAPVNKWHNTSTYTAPISENKGTKSLFQKPHFRAMGKGQTTAESLAFKTKTPHYFGKEINENLKYFGAKSDGVIGLGRFSGGAVPLYYYQSFADYLYENYWDDIEKIIIDTGRELLEVMIQYELELPPW